jgi:alkanesulfonate monooxygenase SsuD/methylene tetrahydromethanopterin reductase-like flavin-dependent oxidoreductase (luciferase family)
VGKHYHYLVINPWVLPLQKPHPPVWIPGISSPETIEWAARHRYPYIALNTTLDVTPDMWKLYRDTAEQEGYTPTSENFGYAIRAVVADSDERAYEEGKHFYWQLGSAFGRSPNHWLQPPGYSTRRAARTTMAFARDTYGDVGYDKARELYQIVTGSPDTVIKKLKHVVDVVNPAWLSLWAREGPMSHGVASRCLELLGREVIPAIKAYVPQPER